MDADNSGEKERLLGSSAKISEKKPKKKKSFWARLKKKWNKKTFYPRTIPIGGNETPKPANFKFPQNTIRNQKYTVFTFLPFTLYEQFKSFINMYYLLLTLSQFIPVLQVGPIFTYAAPLAFVVGLSISMELYLDVRRMIRDREVNGEKYERLTSDGFVSIKASDIKVGHYIRIETNRRIPADMLLLRTTSEESASFVRTDQLDGETDWKLRRAVQCTQTLESDEDLLRIGGEVYAEKPKKDIYDFIGNFIQENGQKEPLSLENTMWASTVLATDTVIGLVLYTGSETRSVINTSTPESKKGILDVEINRLTVILFVLEAVLAFVLIAGGKFAGIWWLDYFKYLVVMSGLIPISMSVNMDVSKFVYAWLVHIDEDVKECVVRNTTIPEELGRISYLLSDKTGTLTQNDMTFKRLNLGTRNFAADSLKEIGELLEQHYRGGDDDDDESSSIMLKKKSKLKKDLDVRTQIHTVVTALGLCHNVTPVHHSETGEIEYQASSPDEVALVKFIETVNYTLVKRTRDRISLRNPLGEVEEFQVLENFPFTSERKRMGIIVKSESTQEIRFIMKGADVIMQQIVSEASSHWLAEDCGDLAREGLRTLVFGQKILSAREWDDFRNAYKSAQEEIVDRAQKVEAAIEALEEGLDLIGVTGVEDKLQEKIPLSLETLRKAGIKIWMLTGDKRETATCIATSSKLAARTDSFCQMELKRSHSHERVRMELANFQVQSSNTVLVIDGGTLEILLESHRTEFFHAAKGAPAVVCCRCSPTQKAEVVRMIRELSGLQCAAIGDGGNDVSMILAANVGIGIVGKEGRQAALAADYSIIQFSHITKLLLWHGRNAYLNSAKMSQMIIHRGTMSGFMQFIYSMVFYFNPVVLYTGFLLLGYSMWYTMAPVFALCINQDVTPQAALLYPELYQELRKGRALTAMTVSRMLLITLYQSAVIIFAGLLMNLNEIDFVALTFNSLVVVLLLNIAMLITRWSPLILVSELATVALVPLVMLILPGSFHLTYVSSWEYWLSLFIIVFLAVFPVVFIKYLYLKINPSVYTRVNEK